MKSVGEGRRFSLISHQVVLVSSLSVSNASHNLKKDSKKFAANVKINDSSVVISRATLSILQLAVRPN